MNKTEKKQIKEEELKNVSGGVNMVSHDGDVGDNFNPRLNPNDMLSAHLDDDKIVLKHGIEVPLDLSE